MGFRIVLEPRTRRLSNNSALLGGRPRRLVRLSPAGVGQLDRLLAEGVQSPAQSALARRLLDAGLASPCPSPVSPAGRVVVVVPARDRVELLDRCLAQLTDPVPVLVVDDGSRDPAALAAAVRRHHATLEVRPRSGGPAAARNHGVAAIPRHFPPGAEVVAFLDSDCEAPPGWLAALLGHFSDPTVVAVAPHVKARVAGATAGLAARFSAAHSPLDLGDVAGDVRPDGAVSYLPAAALLVRRSALEAVGGFDEQLPTGEDVDLVWRLHDAGGRVRFDPRVVIRHCEPEAWGRLLTRRFRYGRSAGPLDRRHPGRLSHLHAQPASLAVVGFLLARRPAPAVAFAAAVAGRLGLRLRGTGVPQTESVRATAAGVLDTARSTGRAATQLALPVVLAAATRRRLRLPLAVLIAADPLWRWWRLRPGIDPIRWTAACLADDVAYGAGVWAGCVRSATAGPLRPRISRVPPSEPAAAGERSRRHAQRVMWGARSESSTGSGRARPVEEVT